MRPRTFIGILLALLVAVTVSYLSNLNSGLLTSNFRLTRTGSVPVYLALIGAFLAGFLPPVSVLLTQTLRRDLQARRNRRLSREARSLRQVFRRAVDLQADGQWARSASELESFLAERPEDFAGLMRYGEALRHLGRASEAVEVHRKASVLYPQSVAVLYQLAEDYDADGQSEVAHQIRDRVLRDFQGVGLPVLRRRRNSALAARDWREASRLQERVESLLAESGDQGELGHEREVRMGLLYQRGVDLLRSERIDEAQEIFRQLLAQEPRFLPALIMQGEAELLRESPDAALAEWSRGYESTGSPVFLQRIEDHFIELEAPLDAIETLHRLMAATENDLLPRFFLGRLYYRLEMHEEALRVLAELRERIQSSPTYHFLLARIHERRGEMDKAVQALSACVGEAGIVAREYVCHVCRTLYPDWMDRCESCGSWNSIEMDFEEEKITAEELGLRPGPIWAIYHGAGSFRIGNGAEES